MDLHKHRPKRGSRQSQNRPIHMYSRQFKIKYGHFGGGLYNPFPAPHTLWVPEGGSHQGVSQVNGSRPTNKIVQDGPCTGQRC